MRTMIATFEARHPGVRIAWTDVPFDAVGSRLVTSALAGRLPAVMNLNADIVAAMALAGRLVDLGSAAPEAVKTFLPSALASCTVGGAVFAFPWYLATDILLWREDLFRDAGIARPPTTFAELPGVCDALFRATKRAAMAPKIGTDSDFLEYCAMEGAAVFDGKKVDLSDPRCAALATLFVDLVAARAIPRGALTASHRFGLDVFARGESAMLLSPPVLGAAGVGNLSAMNIAVAADAPRRDVAVAFAAHVASATWQLELCRRAAVFPSAIEALRDPFFTEGTGSLGEARRIAVKALASARTLIIGLPRKEEAQRRVMGALQAMAFGGKPAAEALIEAASGINARIG
jgi:putative chitobiose transport system substrate-binding protein